MCSPSPEERKASELSDLCSLGHADAVLYSLWLFKHWKNVSPMSLIGEIYWRMFVQTVSGCCLFFEKSTSLTGNHLVFDHIHLDNVVVGLRSWSDDFSPKPVHGGSLWLAELIWSVKHVRATCYICKSPNRHILSSRLHQSTVFPVCLMSVHCGSSHILFSAFSAKHECRISLFAQSQPPDVPLQFGSFWFSYVREVTLITWKMNADL